MASTQSVLLRILLQRDDNENIIRILACGRRRDGMARGHALQVVLAHGMNTHHHAPQAGQLCGRRVFSAMMAPGFYYCAGDTCTNLAAGGYCNLDRNIHRMSCSLRMLQQFVSAWKALPAAAHLLFVIIILLHATTITQASRRATHCSAAAMYIQTTFLGRRPPRRG